MGPMPTSQSVQISGMACEPDFDLGACRDRMADGRSFIRSPGFCLLNFPPRCAVRRFCVACLFLIFICTLTLAQTNPAPLINQPLVPDTVAPGSKGFTLTIHGTGFATDAVVNWNGSSVPTSVISSSEVQATIPAADVAKAGTASVKVTNPAKRNRMSNVVYFPIRNKSTKVAFSIDSHLTASGA